MITSLGYNINISNMFKLLSTNSGRGMIRKYILTPEKLYREQKNYVFKELARFSTKMKKKRLQD